MKKIISLALAAIMCVFCTFTAVADTTISFPMINTTGTIYLKGNAKIETNFVPADTVDDSIVIVTTEAIPHITSVVLEVEGKKYGGINVIKDTYAFVNYDFVDSTTPNPKGTGAYWKLNIYKTAAPSGSLLVENFDNIYSMNVVATGYFETDSSKVYDAWGKTTLKTDNVNAFNIAKTFTSNTAFTGALNDLILSLKSFDYVDKDVTYDRAFLPNTDVDNDGIAVRNEVRILSYSELGEGKGIAGFEGFESQFTEFFNQKLNGKIVFNLTTAPAVLSTVWAEGGIPSTQTGFYTAEKIENDVIGLFFNYDSTGSLLARGTITEDKIIFDISDILKTLSGNTVSTIRTIYYGLIGGINYTGLGRGYKIESVTMSYEEEGQVVQATIDTTVTTEPEIVIDITPETDVPEATIIPDTTTITTTEEAKEEPVKTTDNDENPRTGVTLAVFPSLIAASIGMLSRKRK